MYVMEIVLVNDDIPESKSREKNVLLCKKNIQMIHMVIK